MALRPLQSFDPPRYPTEHEPSDNSLDLKTHLPASWAADPRLCGLVIVFLSLGMSSCSRSTTSSTPSSSPPVSLPVAVVVPKNTANTSDSAPPTHLWPVVAPVFEHGDGVGAIGCVSMSPPVFLSEDEAMAIIREELLDAGINLTDSNVEVSGLPNVVPAGAVRAHSRISKTLSVDACSQRPPISVEFISSVDSELMMLASTSTVQAYDLKKLAQLLVQKASAEGTARTYLGVFYDPVSYEDCLEHDTAAANAASGPASPDGGFSVGNDASAIRAPLVPGEVPCGTGKSASKSQLRAQVKDFIAWLRSHQAL